MDVLDITLVVYKPRWAELETTLRGIQDSSADFRKLRVLFSGRESDLSQLRTMIERLGLPCVDLVGRHDNLGFAAGHNLLLNRSFDKNADWALIYNPDIKAAPGSIELLLGRAKLLSGRFAEPCIFGPILRSADGSGIDSAGIRWTADGRHFDITSANEFDTHKMCIVEGLTGACLLVPSSAYRRIVDASGYFFDPLFVAYREDAELGVRSHALGIKSICVDAGNFEHARGVPFASRRNELVNMLSVQNRLLMRWSLGPTRPGSSSLATLRDLVVIFACATVETSSWPGIRSAFRMRRYAINSGRWYRSNRASGDAPSLSRQAVRRPTKLVRFLSRLNWC